MDSNLFLERFAEQFEETPKEDISLETQFRDLEEWDSMIAMTIIAMVDESYDVRLTGDDIRSSETVKDILAKVQSRLQAN
jgi:acyl carrier protein